MSCSDTMTDSTVNVAVTRGDTMRLTVDLDTAVGDADITGWGWLCQLRDAAGVLAEIITVEPVDPVKGVLELSLTPAQTGAMTPADYVWDLEATDTADDVRTLVSGQLRIREDVSYP